MSSLLVVVSRFREDAQWIRESASRGVPFLVYDKTHEEGNRYEGAVALPNVGREAETFLRFIVEHYEALPDVSVLLQGDPRGTPAKFTHEEAVAQLAALHRRVQQAPGGGALQGPELMLTYKVNVDMECVWTRKVPALFDALFGSHQRHKPFWCAAGAQYALPRAHILCRPRRLYECLHAQALRFGNGHFDSGDPSLARGVDPWTMEVMWGALFEPALELLGDYEARLERAAAGQGLP